MASYFLSKTAQQVDQILSDYYSKNTGNRFVLTTGNQTIAGTKTFSDQIQNSAASNAHSGLYSYICAGEGNAISSDSEYSVIVGGKYNLIDNAGMNSCILNGGDFGSPNSITVSNLCVILNGNGNLIDGGYSNVCNGNNNSIIGTSANCTIDNGMGNTIDESSSYSSIINGTSNTINNAATWSCIVGGNFNTLKSNTASIIGGDNNFIDTGCDGSLVTCGFSNYIYSDSNYSTILNGDSNTINNYAPNSTIIGSKNASILAYHTGAGVWGDSQGNNKPSKGAHTLSLDFASGVYLRLPSFTGSKNQVGNLGELKISGAFLYICTGSNTWGRTTISTF